MTDTSVNWWVILLMGIAIGMALDLILFFLQSRRSFGGEPALGILPERTAEPGRSTYENRLVQDILKTGERFVLRCKLEIPDEAQFATWLSDYVKRAWAHVIPEGRRAMPEGVGDNLSGIKYEIWETPKTKPGQTVAIVNLSLIKSHSDDKCTQLIAFCREMASAQFVVDLVEAAKEDFPPTPDPVPTPDPEEVIRMAKLPDNWTSDRKIRACYIVIHALKGLSVTKSANLLAELADNGEIENPISEEQIKNERRMLKIIGLL